VKGVGFLAGKLGPHCLQVLGDRRVVIVGNTFPVIINGTGEVTAQGNAFSKHTVTHIEIDKRVSFRG
jgi:hypothetical protein